MIHRKRTQKDITDVQILNIWKEVLTETKKLYPKQGESENTYRNAIITEFLGLVANDERPIIS